MEMNGSCILLTELPDATVPDEIIDDGLVLSDIRDKRNTIFNNGLVCKGLTWPVINALVKRKKVASRLTRAKHIRSRELIKSARVICYDVIGEVCILFIYTVIYTIMNILYCDFMCVPRND